MILRFICVDPAGRALWRLSATEKGAARAEAAGLPMIPSSFTAIVGRRTKTSGKERRCFRRIGEVCFGIARVNRKIGGRVLKYAWEWSDLSKIEYEAQQIEPMFWALPGEESWREQAISRL